LEVGLKETKCEQLGDFPPRLYIIKGAMAGNLIRMDFFGWKPCWATKTSKKSLGLLLDKDNHNVPQTFETFKYNLKSRSKGSHIFARGIVILLWNLEKNDSKPS